MTPPNANSESNEFGHEPLEQRLQQQIDRLVDNELDEVATAELLLEIESSRGGWRSLALQLIEAREFAGALREFTTSDPPTASYSSSAPRASRLGFSVPVRIFAAAAVVGLAFFAGRASSFESADSTSEVAHNRAVPSRVVRSPADEFNASRPAGAVRNSDPPNAPRPRETEAESMSVVGFARIVHRVGNGPLVPVIGGQNLDLVTLLNASPHVPDRIRRSYRNRGLEVRTGRRVMSLELSDGQRFAIPLDELGVSYVGHEIL